MKESNKHRASLFALLGIVALGVGLLTSCGGNGNQLVEENGLVSVGYFPQTLVPSSSETYAKVISEGQVDASDPNVYTYNNEKYTLVSPTKAFGEGGGVYSDGSSVSGGQTMLFKWEKIEWNVLYEDKDQNVTFLFAKYTLFARRWQDNIDKNDSELDKSTISGTDIAANDWIHSSIRDYLRNDFYEKAFSKDEKGYLKEYVTKADQSTSSEDCNDLVGLISADTFNKYKDSKSLKGNASDYAKANGLCYHFHNFDSCFFYLNTIGRAGTKYYLSFVRGTEVNGGGLIEIPDNDGDGVRPLIAIDNSKISIAKKESGSSSSSSAGGSSSSIIGIVFSIFGIAGLIVFFILWGKGKIKLKTPVAIVIASVGMVLTSVGVVSLSSASKSGGGIGACGLQYGYYVQSTAQSQGGGIAQVGWTAYLLTSDNAAYYCGAVDDKNQASDFRKELHGTWSMSGSTITITLTGWMDFTTTMQVKCGGKLYHSGQEAYHWVRGE